MADRFNGFNEEELAALAQGMVDLSAAPGHLAAVADRLHDEVQALIDEAQMRREAIVTSLADVLMAANQQGVDFADALAHAMRVYPPRYDDVQGREQAALFNEAIIVLAMSADIDTNFKEIGPRAFNVIRALRRLEKNQRLPDGVRAKAASLNQRLTEACTNGEDLT